MDRRQFIATASLGLVGLILNVKNAMTDGKKVYYSAGEHYDDGTPSDVMAGARLCPSEGKIAVKGFIYDGNEWFEHYFDKPKYSSDLQSIFRNLDGQRITIHSPKHEGKTVVFDFYAFHNFNLERKTSNNGVGLWYDGFMGFGGNSEPILIPIPIYIIDSIKKLYK